MLRLVITALLLPAMLHAAAPDAATRYAKKCNPENEAMVGRACDCIRDVIQRAMPLEDFLKIDALEDESKMSKEQRAQVARLKGKAGALRACAQDADSRPR